MIERNIDKYRIFIFENKLKLTSYLTEYIANKINTSLDVKDRFKFCVCGGSTPRAIYEKLSNFDLPWQDVDIFLGDERCVDPLSDESNTNMLKNSLLKNYASKAYFCDVFKNKDLNDDLANQSGFMTETLAKLYLNQKNYEKAIQSYKILILKFPEKNSYFADQIKKIKKLKK